MLGAGGAAHAVVYALLERGVEQVVVANRTRAPRRFANALAHASIRSHGKNAIPCSTTRRSPSTRQRSAWPDSPTSSRQGRLPGHAVVAELVYWPLVTALNRSARVAGLRTADGLGMLMHQAVRGFLLWFGKKPEVTAECGRCLRPISTFHRPIHGNNLASVGLKKVDVAVFAIESEWEDVMTVVTRRIFGASAFALDVRFDGCGAAAAAGGPRHDR